MSAALLHAILVNHVAHKHASDMAKQVENNLRDKLSEVQAEKEELEQELHRCVIPSLPVTDDPHVDAACL